MKNETATTSINRKLKQRNHKAQAAEAYTGVMFFYMFASLITKVLGFGREIMITSRFTYGPFSDAYGLGFSIPDLVYQLLAGGSITAAVMPLLSGAIENDDEDRVWKPISTFFTVIFIAFFLFTVLGEIFAPRLLALIHYKKSAEVVGIAGDVSRIIFLQTFFFILVAIMVTVLAANKVFGLQVFGDSIYNLFSLLAIGILGGASAAGVKHAAMGIVFAAFMFFAYIFYFARPYMKRFKPNLDVKNPVFRRMIFLAFPSILSGSVAQISFIVRQAFANQFAGAVTSLSNSATLYNLPLQIIVYSIGAMVLPNISGFLARKAYKEASAFFTRILRLSLYLLLPCAILLFVAAEETAQAVFQWNPEKYTMENIAATAGLLRIYAVDVIAQTIIFLVNQLFFAKQKNWIAFVPSVMNLVISPLLMLLFLNVFNLGLAGLAWATVVTNLLVMIITLRLKKKYVPEIKPHGLPQFVVKIIAASFTTFSVLMLVRTLIDNPASKTMQLVRFVVLGLTVVFTYLLSTGILQMREPKMTLELVKKTVGRFTRRKRA